MCWRGNFWPKLLSATVYIGHRLGLTSRRVSQVFLWRRCAVEILRQRPVEISGTFKKFTHHWGRFARQLCASTSETWVYKKTLFRAYPVFQAPPYISSQFGVRGLIDTNVLTCNQNKTGRSSPDPDGRYTFHQESATIIDNNNKTRITFKNKQSSLIGALGGPSPSFSSCGQALPNSVAFLTAPGSPDAVIGTGALKRNGPIGGSAKGIPSHWSTPDPATENPRKVPVGRCISRLEFGVGVAEIWVNARKNWTTTKSIVAVCERWVSMLDLYSHQCANDLSRWCSHCPDGSSFH